jgi:excisionase family DNA binding protein
MSEAGLSRRLPTEDETAIASEAIAKMGKALTREGALPLFVPEDSKEFRIELPSSIGEVVLEVLAHIARGEMVTVVPYGSVLTTQQAADLLNVSRPFLTKLLEAGEIDFHKVGSHRRIRAEELLRYKDRRDSERSDALRDLQRLGQEFEAG